VTKLSRCSWWFSASIILVCPIETTLAQSYAARAIRLVVPYAPGGGADNVARVIAQKLSEALGQQVVIDNRGGAGGIIGADIVAKSAPDGYTLLHDASAHAVNPSLHKLPFDTLKDFAPVGMVVINPNFIVVHPSLPARTVRDLIALAKAHPRQITYGSAGIASAGHLAGELFNYMAGTEMIHVPYKGGGPAIADLMGGHLQVLLPNIANAMPHVKTGKVIGIAVTSAKRSRSAPEFPTVTESGLPGYEIYEWNAVFAPAATPLAIVTKLNAELRKVISTPDVQERFFQMGAEAAPGSPEHLDDYVRSEITKWGKVVKAMGIKVE
jgi:tripartite-type tricarboxylate transporter receptor subunit TctC